MAGGEYFIVRYFLTLSIKIIDGGRGGNNTLANGNLRKYYLQEHTHPLQGSCAGNTQLKSDLGQETCFIQLIDVWQKLPHGLFLVK